MKKLLYFFLFTACLFSQTQRNIWYGFGPYGGTIYEIASRPAGNIAAITNGGLSYLYYEWSHLYYRHDFTHTAFLGDSDTLIAADNDSLYWTDDVGYRWNLITPLQKPVNGIRLKQIPQIKFFLWADSTIYTGDWQGTSWQELNPGKGIINDLYVNTSSDQIIVIATDRGIFRSPDYGTSWVTLPLPEKNYLSLAGDNIAPFKLMTFAGDSNLVYLSSNFGNTWITTSNGLPQGEFELTDAAMSGTGQVYVSASSGVYKTTNFGSNWGPFSEGLEYPDFGIPKVLAVRSLSSSGNLIYAGTDEGIFQKSPSWPQWAQIGPNNQQCLSLGKSGAYFDAVLLGTPKGVKVYNSGEWMAADNYGQEGLPINALILSSQWDFIALAAGMNPDSSGFIQKSTDIGVTWETVFTLPQGAGKFNRFFQRKDSFNVYLALNEGIGSAGLLISYVLNDPSVWTPVPGTEGLNFQFAASFQNDNTGIYFLVNDSLLYKSEDGGRSVEYVSVIPGGPFNSLYAIQHTFPENNLYACGQGIRYSTDNGLSWADYGLNQYEIVRLIYESTSILAATRHNGYFARYHSVGDWEPFSVGFGKGEIIVDAMNYTTWVLHTATANHSLYYLWLIINGVEEEGAVRPGEMHLTRNYPNPFNPSTNIRYTLGSRQLISLKVYDMLGREVAVLVNEEKPAGTYEAVWNAHSLPTGVYFCRLRAGIHEETRKMLLLK